MEEACQLNSHAPPSRFHFETALWRLFLWNEDTSTSRWQPWHKQGSQNVISLSLSSLHGVFECVMHVACASSPVCLLNFCPLTYWSVWTWLIISTVRLHHIIGRLKNAFTHTGCYEWSDPLSGLHGMYSPHYTL